MTPSACWPCMWMYSDGWLPESKCRPGLQDSNRPRVQDEEVLAALSDFVSQCLVGVGQLHESDRCLPCSVVNLFRAEHAAQHADPPGAAWTDESMLHSKCNATNTFMLWLFANQRLLHQSHHYGFLTHQCPIISSQQILRIITNSVNSK